MYKHDGIEFSLLLLVQTNPHIEYVENHNCKRVETNSLILKF